MYINSVQINVFWCLSKHQIIPLCRYNSHSRASTKIKIRDIPYAWMTVDIEYYYKRTAQWWHNRAIRKGIRILLQVYHVKILHFCACIFFVLFTHCYCACCSRSRGLAYFLARIFFILRFALCTTVAKIKFFGKSQVRLIGLHVKKLQSSQTWKCCKNHCYYLMHQLMYSATKSLLKHQMTG